jgi:hypothetical protein
MTCFKLGDMKALTPSQRLQYSQATSIFTRVQAYNNVIRGKRLAGNTQVSYYVFNDSTEKTMFTLGQFILTQNDPTNAVLYATVKQI